MNCVRHLMAAVVASFAGATAALAEPLALDWQDEDQWRYSLTLSAFLPARTTGTSTVAGTSVDLDLSFGDAINLLDFALAGRGEMWHRDFGVILDLNYVNLGLNNTLTLPVPPAPAANVNVDVKQSWAGLLLAKRVVNSTYGADNLRYSLDLQAGARLNRIKQQITLTTPGPAPVLGGTETWLEPVIGGRGIWELSDKWSGVLSADFGGFGAGGNDLQFGLNASVTRKIGKNKSLRLGYRYYSIDYSTTRSDGLFAYDVVQHGPILAFTWYFQ